MKTERTYLENKLQTLETSTNFTDNPGNNEIGFNLIKENKDIHVLNVFDHTYLYTAYDDDNTFFLKDKVSVKEVMKVFDIFSIYFGSKLKQV